MKLAAVLPLLFASACIASVHADSELKAPAKGTLTVAFVLSDGANVIDFAGAWEVFQDTARPGSEEPGFALYTVSESRKTLTLTGGLKVVPDHTFADAPPADVVVVGANGMTPGMVPWLKKMGNDPHTQALMSVCTTIPDAPTRCANRRAMSPVPPARSSTRPPARTCESVTA